MAYGGSSDGIRLLCAWNIIIELVLLFIFSSGSRLWDCRFFRALRGTRSSNPTAYDKDDDAERDDQIIMQAEEKGEDQDETKTAPAVACKIMNDLGFFCMAHVSPVGTKGGLLLAWRLGVELECFITNVNTITVWCYSDPVNNPWLLTCVYGSPTYLNRQYFWDNIMKIGDRFSGPWICIRDFNMILDQSDKFGGLPYATSSRDFFRTFMNTCGMIDLSFSGNPFTWFEEFWTKHPECRSVILAAWDSFFSGSSAFILAKKLKSTKQALKIWNYWFFGNIQRNINSISQQIDDIQQSNFSSHLHREEIFLKQELDSLYIQEELLWKSKSRDTWLTCKDLNTRYFHMSTLIKRRRNAIDFLKLPSGAWVSDRRNIGNCFTDFFQQLFSSSLSDPPEEMLNLFDKVISDEENLVLCSIPSEKEIYEVLISIGATKAPGPDGFTALFYQRYWSIVKEVVLNCVWDFFKKNHLLKEQNHTFIALIPKRLGPFSVNHFRPISLCNIIYKIISKLLANRFKILLHHFISPNQSAFVPSRTIHDSSILALELLHTIKSKKGRGGLMAVKIDMEKAFDRMEWGFLLSILIKPGFNSIWINWIRICISSTSFSILINGSPFGLFTPSRGLRQGDPLSPFLFILGTEALSRILQQQESLGILKGIKIAKNCPPINHLLFADDLIIFAKATSTEAISIKCSLDLFCSWSGQKVNTGKSSLLFSKNTLSSTIRSIKGIIPYKTTSSTSYYLGLPFIFGKSKRVAFQPILDKVLNKIERWRAKTLSQAGRTVLIKATAAAIPSYAMSTFMLPVSICKMLDRSFKNFWWGFPKDKSRNLSLKSWSSICLPRSQGGLGIRDMKSTNLALISKLGWKILNNSDNIWVQFLQKKYIRYGNFLTSPLFYSASYFWKGLQKCKSLIQSGACLQVAVNSDFEVWTTPWTMYLWISSTSGQFTTKSAYQVIKSNLQVNSPLPGTSSNFWKSIWKLNLNDRLRFFIWKIAWNILPTKERLNSVFSSTDITVCPLCKSGEDSIHHLFFNCIFARVIWQHSYWPIDSTTFHFTNMLDWIKVLISPGLNLNIPKEDHHRFQIFASVTCDTLWSSRNKAYHENLSFDALQLSRKILKVSQEHMVAWKSISQQIEEKWIPPPPQWFKINFDTAIRDTFSTQAAVCRNHLGHIIKIHTKTNSPCQPNEGEALAANLAVSLANSLNIQSFILERDSQIVILALQHPDISQDWRISSVIHNTIDSIPADSSWSARKVNRSANFCAHYVAHWAAARVTAGSIPTYPPPIPSIRIVSGKDPPFH
ncbi:uncharacterized protein LOC133881146 [Alnus glutinosa]|uniref:uncharacterized protein LOC133881146 n=1 Tax=Alnus glutinosa TaxID=3517 RepID=UPI002D7812F0|nr:uncharacterized protein LOC133881146 [Alnus glutinosa]